MRIVVGISGASGALYGVALLRALQQAPGVETLLVATENGWNTLAWETGLARGEVQSLACKTFANDDLFAPIASGSYPWDAMVVLPCSMKTLSGIANGYSQCLLERAADVSLKEGRRLILCPRETPLSAIHLENMLKLSRLGVHIAPPMPGFYQKPQTVEDIVSHTVMKVMDLLNIPYPAPRWGE